MSGRDHPRVTPTSHPTSLNAGNRVHGLDARSARHDRKRCSQHRTLPLKLHPHLVNAWARQYRSEHDLGPCRRAALGVCMNGDREIGIHNHQVAGGSEVRLEVGQRGAGYIVTNGKAQDALTLRFDFCVETDANTVDALVRKIWLHIGRGER